MDGMGGQDIFGLVGAVGIMVWLFKSVVGGIKRGDMHRNARTEEWEDDDDDDDTEDYVWVKKPRSKVSKVKRYR